MSDTYYRFFYKDGFYIKKTSGREFDEEIKDAFPEVSAVCHNLSFAQIENVIYHSITAFENSEETGANLFNLCIAVAHLNSECKWRKDAQLRISNICQCLNSIPHLMEIEIESIEPPEQEKERKLARIQRRKDVCKNLNELLYILNNARENLRIGNSRWNSSIGEEFDPVSWCFVEKKDEKIQVLSSESGIRNPEAEALPNIFTQYPPVGTGFYLTSMEEGAVIDYIIEQVKPEAQINLYTAENKLYNKPFIFSSSNKGEEFYPTNHMAIQEIMQPIYHLGIIGKEMTMDKEDLIWGWKLLTGTMPEQS